MDNKFSQELKDLVFQSREMAINLGYDYISSIHFLLADCESKREDSIINFGFKAEDEYQNFKKHYTLEKKGLLEFINESLPLTKEAELTIKLSIKESKSEGLKLVLPKHLFIAALKNQNSLVYECFKNDEKALEKLIAFYKIFENQNSEKSEDIQSSNKILSRQSLPKNNMLAQLKSFLGLR